MEALVLQDGSCLLDRKTLVAILKTYTNKEHLTFEAGPNWIKFGTTIMNTAGYSTKAEAPGEFQVFPVRDTWITRFAMA